MTDTTPLDPVPDEAPVSDKFVYLYLQEHGPATKRKVARATGYTVRTVRRAIYRLEEYDLVERAGVADYEHRRYEWQTARG